MQAVAVFMMSNQKENNNKEKEDKTKSPNITDATAKDWADFFNMQEDFNYMFDR